MKSYSFLPFLYLLICLFLPMGANGETLLIHQGKGAAQIVIPEKPPRTVKMAAEELQRVLKRMTGVELPISSRKDDALPVHLYVGRSAHTDALNVSPEGLKAGAYRMVSGKNWLVFLGADRDYQPREPWGQEKGEAAVAAVLAEWDKITGTTFGNPFLSLWRKVDQKKTGLWEFDLDHAGSFNAVTRFLNDLGVRWYLPGEIGEVIPKLSTVALPEVDRTVNPDFPLRNLYLHGANFMGGNEEKILWQMRMGVNQGQDLIAFGPNVGVSHGMKWVIDREEMKRAHPEFYFLEGEMRLTEKGVPCLSSEELVQQNARYLRAIFDHYDVPMASVMPTDGFVALCQCGKCKGKATPARGYFGTMSNYVWSYVAKVAEEVAKTHPDRKIHCLAYTSYLLPPDHIGKLPPNVIVGFAQSPSVFHDPSSRAFYADLREQWKKKVAPGNRFYQYEYYLHGWRDRWPGVPAIYPRLIVEDLRALKPISMGNYIEVFPTPANEINYYITARFSWDVNQDLDAVMDEYYRLFYGPAEVEMKAFIEYAQTHWMEMLKSIEAIDGAFSRIEKARRSAGDGIYGERVARFQTFMEPMRKRREQLVSKQENARKLRAMDRSRVDLTLDGRLDDPFWSDLPEYEMVEVNAAGETKPKTTVRLAWKDQHLLVAIRCEEPKMEKLGTGITRNDDPNIWYGDSVEIMIETPVHSHYQIAISPAGGILDVDRSSTINTLWTSGAEVKTARDPNGWTVEARIPVAEPLQGEVDLLNSVVGFRPEAKAPWYVNVGRLRFTDGERETFSLTGHGFHDKLHFAELVVETP